MKAKEVFSDEDGDTRVSERVLHRARGTREDEERRWRHLVWRDGVVHTGVPRSYETAPPPPDNHRSLGIVLL